MNRLIAVVVVVCAIQLAPDAWAQTGSSDATSATDAPPESKLAVGDPCPPLAVERFLKGTPVSALERGKVYVVEFWATWCRPCIQAIPHLTALQAKYESRGVKIIGVNVQELRRSGQGWEETFDEQMQAKVESFVQQQGDRMAYTIAYDGAAKAMDKAWREASGSKGLPTTFIVDRAGKIAWIGHPMVLRMPLNQIAEGTWDLETGPERVKKAEDAYLEAMRRFATDPTAGLEAWDKAAKDYPILAEDLIGPKFDALIAAGLVDAAYAAGERLFERAIQDSDAEALNGLAWSIVSPATTLARRDLDLALRAATAANELTEGKEPPMLDTLARVHFWRGDIRQAIELQTRAVELADEPMKAGLAPALEEFERAKR